MATSSILGGDRAPLESPGRDTDALGPSDSTDTGSDVQGEQATQELAEGEIGGDLADLASDTDASGTGERATAEHDTRIEDGADIAPDRIVVGAPDLPATEVDDLSEADIDSLTDDANGDAGTSPEDEGEDEAGAT